MCVCVCGCVCVCVCVCVVVTSVFDSVSANERISLKGNCVEINKYFSIQNYFALISYFIKLQGDFAFFRNKVFRLKIITSTLIKLIN